MPKNQIVSGEYFVKRLADLCLRSGLSGFPREGVKQHILLKSMVLIIGNSGSFTEQEINAKLQYWIGEIGRIRGIDHVTLRRRLVDMGYLTRSNDGSCYEVTDSWPQPPMFEDAVDRIDVEAAMRAARDEIARKKREYAEKSRCASNSRGDGE